MEISHCAMGQKDKLPTESHNINPIMRYIKDSSLDDTTSYIKLSMY